MRGNLDAELYMGDGPGSTGLLMAYDHPHTAPNQLKLYAELGEVRHHECGDVDGEDAQRRDHAKREQDRLT